MSTRTVQIGVIVVVVLSLLGVLAQVVGLRPDLSLSRSEVVETGPTPTAGQGPTRTPAGPTPTPAGPTPTPVSVGANKERRPLVLLNPAVVRPGATVGVSGSGFDPGATVDLKWKRTRSDREQDLGFVQADQGGNFGGFSFTVPAGLTNTTFIVVARQRGGSKQAETTGQVALQSPVVKLGTQVGQPGTSVAFSAEGFLPKEEVDIYWNSVGGQPIATVRMDESGGLRQGTLRVPFGAAGNNAFIFVGKQSQSPVTASFLLLNLYPTLTLSTYAARADTTVTFTGEGFGPRERVRIHLNTPDSPPVTVVETDEKGGFSNAGAFTLPFELSGKNTFIAIGEQSQAPATVSFDVLPYTPSVEPSTYGGRPGTVVTFYGKGFARNEIVHVYLGRGQNSPGREVACFLTDGQGEVRAGGAFTIPADVQGGKLVFTFVGGKSRATTTTAMEVIPAEGPVPNAPPSTADFKCSLSAATAGPTPTAPAGATPAPTATPARATVGGAQPAPVRRQPGSGAETVAVLAPGTVVETLAERREAEGQVWQRVRLADGREGWLPLPALGGEPGRR